MFGVLGEYGLLQAIVYAKTYASQTLATLSNCGNALKLRVPLYDRKMHSRTPGKPGKTLVGHGKNLKDVKWAIRSQVLRSQ